MLRAHGVEVLADVRRFPASRKYPQFNGAALEKVLASNGINYQHLEKLGGRRPARKDSRNTAWRNLSFRGYADYMESDEFAEGVERLVRTASYQATAMMCAESVWWRCHRGLISDYLKVRGWQVLHIMSESKAEEHPYTSAARIVEGVLEYSPEEDQLSISFENGDK